MMRAGGEVGAVRVKGGSRQLRAPDSEERGPVAIACRSGDFGTMRDFNTAGPVRPEKNYCIPPLDRLNLRQVLALIRRPVKMSVARSAPFSTDSGEKRAMSSGTRLPRTLRKPWIPRPGRTASSEGS